MSSTVIHPGSTGAPRPTGRFVGLAAAGLAVAIALGVAFQVSRSDDSTEAPSQASVAQANDAAWESRVDFLTRQYEMRARQETAAVAAADISPSVSPEAYKALQGRPKPDVKQLQVQVPQPVLSPEALRIGSINTTRLQAMWDQRYQDLIDRFEHMTVPKPTAALTGLVPVTPEMSTSALTGLIPVEKGEVDLPREKRGIGH